MLKIGSIASPVILADYWCTCSHLPRLLRQCRKGETNRWSQRWENEKNGFSIALLWGQRKQEHRLTSSLLTAPSFSHCSPKGGRYAHWDRWVKNAWMSFDSTVLAIGFCNGFHHLGICRIDSVKQHIRSGPYTIDDLLLWCRGWNWFWQGAY